MIKPHSLSLVLIRHGRTNWTRLGKHNGQTDIPLDDHGRDQAFQLRTALAPIKFTTRYSSPLARAAETASIIFPSTDVAYSDLLTEWNYGAFEGLTADEIRGRYPSWSPWGQGFAGGETLEEIYDRTQRFFRSLENECGHVAIVSHGHVLRLLTCLWMNREPHWAAHLSIDPASCSVLSWEYDRPALKCWNVTPGALRLE